jgi:hypothetical protein
MAFGTLPALCQKSRMRKQKSRLAPAFLSFTKQAGPVRDHFIGAGFLPLVFFFAMAGTP